MEKTALLKLRKQNKAKKPIFVRQDVHKKAEISKKWRRPKGLQSKMRLQLKGYRKCPSKGYKAPAAIRGLHGSGLLPVMVYSKKDLEQMEIKSEGAVVAKTVGLRKKIDLVNYAKENGINVLNIKDLNQFLTKANEKLKERKEIKEKKQKEKEKKKKTAKPKKKEDLAEKLTDEEKKEQEKKDRDKLLTKKEA